MYLLLYFWYIELVYLLDMFNVIWIFSYIESTELVWILDFKYILLLLLLLYTYIFIYFVLKVHILIKLT